MMIASVRSVRTALPSAATRWNFTSKRPRPCPHPEQLDDSLPTAHGGVTDVLVQDVVGQRGVGRVEVLVLQRIKERLHDASVGCRVHC